MASKRILVVVDSSELRDFLVEHLAKADDYTVVTAGNADEGWTLARELRPDLLIADHSKSHETGLALLAALREAGQWMPMILIAAEGSEQLAVQALRLGVRDYLAKPLSPDELIKAVEHVLSENPDVSLITSKAPGDSASQYLEALFHHTEDAIIAVDRHHNILFCNAAACRLFEVANDSPVALRPLAEVIQNEDVLSLFSRAIPGDHPQRSEITLQNGRLILNAQLTPVRDVGRIAIMQNITGLKELDSIKNKFARQVSSDIRSPLTTILGYVELIGRMGPVNESQQRFIDRIVFSVQSITALLSDLLELSNIETDFDTSRESIQLPLVVRYAVEGKRRQFEEKKQALKVRVPERVAPILGNPLHLRQMVDNLLDNASKYTADHGAISVTLSQEDDFLVLQVMDSGIGIPAEEQPHVFEKFYRAQNVVGLYEGTGLGLAIVQSIVEAHDGRIWLESCENGGTTFTVMFPAYYSPRNSISLQHKRQEPANRSAY